MDHPFTVSPQFNTKTRCYYLTCDQDGEVNYGVGGGTLSEIQQRADEWNARPVTYEVSIPSPSTAFRDMGFRLMESYPFTDREEAIAFARLNRVRRISVRSLGPGARYIITSERVS